MRAWWPVATASKPRRSARSSSRSNLRWRLHSTHGFGVRPAAWSSRYGPTTWAQKSSPKLNVWWSMPRWSATRRASSTSLTEQHPVSLSPPHSLSVTPTTSWPSSQQPGGGDRRVDPTGHGDEDRAPSGRLPHAAARPRPARRRARGRRRRRSSTSRATAAARPTPTTGRPRTPPARARGPSRPLAHDDPADAAMPASSSRNSSASLSTPGKHRCAEPATLCERSSAAGTGARPTPPARSPSVRRATGAVRSVTPTSTASGTAARRPSTSRSRRAPTRATARLALGRHQASGDGEAHGPGDVLGAAAPVTLLAAADLAGGERRAGSHDQRADALRATDLVAADRDQVGVARRARRRRARPAPAPRRCGGRRAVPGPARPRRPRRAAGSCRSRCWRASPTRSRRRRPGPRRGGRGRPRRDRPPRPPGRRSARPARARRGARSAEQTATAGPAVEHAEHGEVVGLGPARR